jgi:hypothetical protein
MPYPVIIGIAGPARSGKDTVADFLVAETGGYIYSLAAPLKAMLLAGLGVDMALPYWQGKKEEPIGAFGKSPRQLLQTLGTERGRDMVNPDIWLIMATIRLKRSGGGMIIPDIRFENEAQWIRDRGGTIIHLRRKEAPNINPHSSEGGVALALGETTIHNDGSLQDLQNSVGEVVDGWKAGE